MLFYINLLKLLLQPATFLNDLYTPPTMQTQKSQKCDSSSESILVYTKIAKHHYEILDWTRKSSRQNTESECFRSRALIDDVYLKVSRVEHNPVTFCTGVELHILWNRNDVLCANEWLIWINGAICPRCPRLEFIRILFVSLVLCRFWLV